MKMYFIVGILSNTSDVPCKLNINNFIEKALCLQKKYKYILKYYE